MGKAAIVNPYFDTLGGGERYTISFAKVLSDMGFVVDVQWGDETIGEKIKKRFGIDTSKINFIDDVKRGDGYDVCFWVSDGSIPLLRARKNILHFQVPFKDVNGDTLLNKMKLMRVSDIVCNSKFTKEVIDGEFSVESKVIYPPIDTNSIKPKRKQNIILFVGRFSDLLQTKHQDVLVDSFKRLDLPDWKLVLAGGTDVGGRNFFESLKRDSSGFNIEIIDSPDYKTLLDLYGVSKIFWSASGYGVDEIENPQKVEHFGMSVVEAMVAGGVPILYNAGGHKEIVEHGTNGYLWSNPDELIKITEKLITEKGALRDLSEEAKKVGLKYGYEEFRKSVAEIL